MRFSAESSLLLAREYPDLKNHNIEPAASKLEELATRRVGMVDSQGDLRVDLYSKLKRRLWTKYNAGRWQKCESTVRAYKDSKLIHTELNLDTKERAPNAKRVVTLHDLIPVRNVYPGAPYFGNFGETVRERWEAGAVFCCVSAFTADDLRDFLNCDSERIIVTPNVIAPIFKPSNDDSALEAWRQRLGLNPGERYVVAHTGEIKRKNLVSIIRVLHAVRNSGHPDLKLVFAGFPKKLPEQFSQLVPAYIPWQDFVKFTGNLVDSDFPVIYSGAELLLFLSYAEGFGLPPLEAMACGLPVVSSDRTSLKEVVGNAGLLVDPDDIEGASAAVASILESPETRDNCIEAGFLQAASCSWEKTGKELRKAWRIALES